MQKSRSLFMKKPLVSIIMAAYNAEKTIQKSIESVLGQTYPNIEFIICDDGSTDATRDIIKKYPTIQYLYQGNQGQGAARNNSALNAKGEYLAFIDADDCWAPEKLDVQINLFKVNIDTAAVYCDMRIVDIYNNLIGFNAKGRMKRGYIFNDLLSGNYMCGLSTLVVKKNIWRETSGFSNHRYCQDFFFLLKIAEKYRFDFSDRPMVEYLLHDNNITAKIDISYPEQISFYKEIPLLYCLNDQQKKIVKAQLRRLYFAYAVLHFRRKNFLTTAFILKEAKTQRLLFWKSFALFVLNVPFIRKLAYNKI
jgi:glycosyltransferase involved in cell wall biosynthesis